MELLSAVRVRRVLGRVAVASLLCAAPIASALAENPPTIDDVMPMRIGDLLASAVHTSHLPGAVIAGSLESGLPSAVELSLDLRDDHDRTVAQRTVFYRIAFDLWEEIFRLQGPGEDRTFPDLRSLESFLSDIPRVSVASLDRLDPRERHRIRVGCRLHPVAPRETERLDEWLGGETPDAQESRRNANSASEREVSVSLGRVIRFFYRGQRDDEEVASRFSAWFVPDDLPESAESPGVRK
ncbi:MAG: DUF4390 domain-containing protein [bacterium]